MLSPDVELTERSVQLQAGIEKDTKTGLEGEALEIVKKAVFVDGVYCFRTGIREDDPPALSQSCVCVSIQDQYLHVHVREALLRKKQNF